MAAGHLAEVGLSRVLPDLQWALVSLHGQFIYCQTSPRQRLVMLLIAGGVGRYKSPAAVGHMIRV